jgi:transcription antitermination factor NusA-like protein
MLDHSMKYTLTIAHIMNVDPYLPGFKAYLPELRRRAVLPAGNVSRQNLIGEYTWAVVISETEDGDVLISQTPAQYFLRLTECFLGAEQAADIEVIRVAVVAGNAFVKIAVRSLNGHDPVKVCIETVTEQIKKYTDFKMIFIRYDEDVHQYIKNSLYPCPEHAVREVIYTKSDAKEQATVRVEEKYIPLCMGKGGTNVAAASKLVKLKLNIKPVIKHTQ